MSEAPYIYDQAWQRERERLAGIEATWDPGSRQRFEALGVGPGAAVLEVGAGGGALAQWLAERVGTEGRVVATDLDTRFLEAIDAPNLDVRRHDLLADPVLDEGFDAVHARLVLEHIPERGRALDNLIGAARPGGWVLVEDFDWGSASVDPPSELFEKVTEVILGFMADAAGFDPIYGRRLVQELTQRGLEDVEAEGRVRLQRAGDPGLAFARLSLEQLRDPLVEQERLTAEEVEEALRALDDPEVTLVSAILVAAWGRRPA